MQIETKRLIIQPLEPTDLASLKLTLQDKQAMYAYEHAFSDQEVEEWLDRNLTRYKKDGFGLWRLVRKEDHKFIGQCGLTKQNFNQQEVVEIGYLLQRDFWHEGYATEAAQAVKEYAFNQLDLEEVWSIIRDNNLASMNVAIRNKMLVRGITVKEYYGIKMPHYGFSVRKNQELS